MDKDLDKEVELSIIVINYNTYDLTCSCIQSVIEHTKGIAYELILVDNSSTECDPSLFESRFPIIRLIRSDRNLGFAKGNNLGISQARGAYILLLNSDAFLQDNRLLPCLSYLSTHPRVGVVTTKLVFPDGRVQSTCQRFPSVWYNLLELIRFQKVFPKLGAELLLGPFFDYQKEVKVDWTWGAFFMFRKSLLEQLPSYKLYDDFFMYGEDMWWCWDIKKLGFDIVFLPGGHIIHLMGASSGPKKVEMEKNRKAFMQANYSWTRRMAVYLSELLVRKIRFK